LKSPRRSTRSATDWGRRGTGARGSGSRGLASAPRFRAQSPGAAAVRGGEAVLTAPVGAVPGAAPRCCLLDETPTQQPRPPTPRRRLPGGGSTAWPACCLGPSATNRALPSRWWTRFARPGRARALGRGLADVRREPGRRTSSSAPRTDQAAGALARGSTARPRPTLRREKTGPWSTRRSSRPGETGLGARPVVVAASGSIPRDRSAGVGASGGRRAGVGGRKGREGRRSAAHRPTRGTGLADAGRRRLPRRTSSIRISLPGTAVVAGRGRTVL